LQELPELGDFAAESRRGGWSELPPDRIPELAVRGLPSVSYTYTDPVVYYEYTRDACIRSRAPAEEHLVTAAYINPEPWKKLLAHVDAVRIDLKSMSDEFYRQICDASCSGVERHRDRQKHGVELELVHRSSRR
jgi:pyruvate-formate lyase-activating enzyme